MAESEAGGALSGAASGAAAGSMFGPWGTVIGAGIGAVGSYLGQSSANSANIKQAEMQMAFQREMDNTKYQRSVRDLKEAGLNPMLAYTNGVTPAPQGAKAEIRDAMGPAVNSAIQAGLMQAQLDNIKADTGKKETEAAVNAATVPKLEADTQTSGASADELRSRSWLQGQQGRLVLEQAWNESEKIKLTKQEQELMVQTIKNSKSQGDLINANTGNVRVDTVLKNLEVPRARNEAEAEKSWFKKEVSPYTKDIGTITHSAANVGRMIRGAPSYSRTTNIHNHMPRSKR